MSFLNQMKAKKKEMFSVKHPLAAEDNLLKMSYLIGIALLLSRVDDDLCDAERVMLADMVSAMDLPGSRLEKIISRANDADGGILDEILPLLTVQGISHCFVLDLHRAAQADREFKDEEREFIAIITEMMQLSADETAFLNAFAAAAHAQDSAAANAAVQQALEKKIDPVFSQLQFFLPGFRYVEELAGFTLGNHETRTINRPIYLSGPVTVGKGAKLTIKNAVVTFGADAQLLVDGGVLELEDATLIAEPTEGDPLLVSSNNTPVLEIINCAFDGRGKRPLVATLAGKTVFNSCTFKNALRRGNPVAISAKETSAAAPINTLISLTFLVSTKGFEKATDSDSGATEEEAQAKIMGAGIFANSLLILQNCTFSDMIAETGAGAVHASGQLQIANCTFSNCQSLGIGGAVVASDSYTIKDCRFENCRANGEGGALNISGGDQENSKLENCMFTRCASTKNGGGLYLHGVKYSATGCTFEDCSATEAGGGAATDEWDQTKSHFRQCLFSRCTSKEGGGLRIMAQYGPSVSETTYTDCIPDGYKHE